MGDVAAGDESIRCAARVYSIAIIGRACVGDVESCAFNSDSCRGYGDAGVG